MGRKKGWRDTHDHDIELERKPPASGVGTFVIKRRWIMLGVGLAAGIAIGELRLSQYKAEVDSFTANNNNSITELRKQIDDLAKENKGHTTTISNLKEEVLELRSSEETLRKTIKTMVEKFDTRFDEDSLRESRNLRIFRRYLGDTLEDLEKEANK